MRHKPLVNFSLGAATDVFADAAEKRVGENGAFCDAIVARDGRDGELMRHDPLVTFTSAPPKMSLVMLPKGGSLRTSPWRIPTAVHSQMSLLMLSKSVPLRMAPSSRQRA